MPELEWMQMARNGSGAEAPPLAVRSTVNISCLLGASSGIYGIPTLPQGNQLP